MLYETQRFTKPDALRNTMLYKTHTLQNTTLYETHTLQNTTLYETHTLQNTTLYETQHFTKQEHSLDSKLVTEMRKK